MTANADKPVGNPARIEYPNPPIVEGLCQLDFATPLPWGPILPGMFFSLVRAEYPEEPEVQQQVQANVQFDNDAAGQAQFTVGQGDQRLVYRNESRNRLLLLSPSTLSANSLPAYEGWPALAARISRAVEKSKRVLKDAKAGSVTVRYINRIVLPQEAAVRDYFTIPLRSFVGIDDAPEVIFQRAESVFPDGSTRGILTFASVEREGDEPEGSKPFILDLEFRHQFAEPTALTQALTVADQLKTLENREFEACITDRARELFR